MCFHVSKRHSKKLIAQKDIPCAKLMLRFGDTFKSLHRGMIYPVNGFLDSKIGKIKTCSYSENKIIEVGIHSWNFNKFQMNTKNHFTFNSVMEFNKKHPFLLYVYCLIPEGAEYYYNSVTNEYVSNSIQILGEL